MRRDVFIENDSGGFSVLAADAVDDIIEDGRADDFRFVTGYKAMLLELYGDDSMPVRIVVDEPLGPEEEAQWLARASWRIDTSDGHLLVMGGFDPDVLSWWKEGGADGDGRGVGALKADPGSWRVDVYAHVGSMNGREVLSESGELPGTAFRRSHPDRPFPLWLAKMLEFSGEEDPGFEDAWKDIRASMAGGRLSIDTESGDPIGFLVHFTRSAESAGDPPDGGWFDRTANSRVPKVFPTGLVSDAPDRELRSFHDRLLDIRAPEPERPIADKVVEVIEVWSGDPLKPIDGGPVAVRPEEIYFLHWQAAMTADSPPRFELWVDTKGAWTAPAATADFAVVAKSGGVTAIGPVANTGGWHTWWTSRSVALTLGSIPDGATIDFAMAPRLDYDAELDPTVGRALYSGTVKNGAWQIAESSPRVSHDTLAAALGFIRDLANGRMQVRAGPERAAFDKLARVFSPEPGSLVWEGDVVHLAEPDDRTMLMLGKAVFRLRFAGAWPMDKDD